MAHNHSHHHGHNHHHHASASLNKAFAIAVLLNFSYSATEAIYAMYASSMGLLADAVHNFGDVLGLLLAWMANWLLSFPARKRYSYGFKKTTIIASLANAFILVATSALIAYESIYKLFHLTSINENIVIVVGLIGIVINGGSSMLFMKNAHDDLNVKGAFLHLLADALIVAGVVVSAIVIKYTQWLWIDPILGLIIVGMVLWGTWGLLRDSISLILDAIPHYVDHIGVRKYLSELPGVTAIHDFHIWGLSTKEVALTVHLIMPETKLSDLDYKNINEHLHSAFHINHATLQVESGSSHAVCNRIESC